MVCVRMSISVLNSSALLAVHEHWILCARVYVCVCVMYTFWRWRMRKNDIIFGHKIPPWMFSILPLKSLDFQFWKLHITLSSWLMSMRQFHAKIKIDFSNADDKNVRFHFLWEISFRWQTHNVYIYTYMGFEWISAWLSISLNISIHSHTHHIAYTDTQQCLHAVENNYVCPWLCWSP